MADIEAHIGNDKQTGRGGTGMAIYYLRSIDQISHKESVFGYSSRFEGLGIYLNSIFKNEVELPDGTKEFTNAIQGVYNDGQ